MTGRGAIWPHCARASTSRSSSHQRVSRRDRSEQPPTSDLKAKLLPQRASALQTIYAISSDTKTLQIATAMVTRSGSLTTRQRNGLPQIAAELVSTRTQWRMTISSSSKSSGPLPTSREAEMMKIREMSCGLLRYKGTQGVGEKLMKRMQVTTKASSGPRSALQTSSIKSNPMATMAEAKEEPQPSLHCSSHGTAQPGLATMRCHLQARRALYLARSRVHA